jgi:hypothetical protein
MEDLVAGESGFDEFFRAYHDELRCFGKRPDMLVFRAGQDPPIEWKRMKAAELVRTASQALAALEIRASQQSLTGFRTLADLSFTPKIEDIRNVMRWSERHGVLPLYVQVVFGAVYAISFEGILELLVAGPKAGGFTIDRVPRNQFKSTLYIPLSKGVRLSTAFQEPELSAFGKQLSSA